MYRTGHYGVSLLAYAPVGFAFLVFGAPGLALVGGAVMVALAGLPDVDIHLPFVKHRGSTHTLLFAVLVGAVTSVVAWTLAPQLGLDPELAGIVGFGVGWYAVVAHLFADVLTPMGIAPFWPLSSRRYSLGVTRADNVLANWTLLLVGTLATVIAAVAGGRLG